MINVNKLFKFLNKNGINFFSGVPDSILKNTKWYLDNKNKKQHIIIGPWNHGQAISGGSLSLGEFEFTPESVIDVYSVHLDFFDFCLVFHDPVELERWKSLAGYY